MSPPPEPTWRSDRPSQLGDVTPVARVFMVIGTICAIFGLLIVALFAYFFSIFGDPGGGG